MRTWRISPLGTGLLVVLAEAILVTALTSGGVQVGGAVIIVLIVLLLAAALAASRKRPDERRAEFHATARSGRGQPGSDAIWHPDTRREELWARETAVYDEKNEGP